MENPSESQKFIDDVIIYFEKAVDFALTQAINVSSIQSFFPGGNNGPHYALETPLRNTSHAAILFYYAWKITGKELYYYKAELLYSWLLDSKNIHKQKGWIFRQSSTLDTSNGVIGPSWLLEALTLDNLIQDRAADAIAAIKNSLRFNHSLKAWEAWNMRTKKWKPDFTFDHQAWCCFAMSSLGIKDEVNLFLSECDTRSHIKVQQNRLISHLLHSSTIQGKLRSIHWQYRLLSEHAVINKIEQAYQHYTILPFALLKLRKFNHSFLESEKLHRALSYITESTITNLAHNELGYSYNNPFLELPTIKLAYPSQCNYSWSFLANGFCEFVEIMLSDDPSTLFYYDRLTLISRLYEFARSLYFIVSAN